MKKQEAQRPRGPRYPKGPKHTETPLTRCYHNEDLIPTELSNTTLDLRGPEAKGQKKTRGPKSPEAQRPRAPKTQRPKRPEAQEAHTSPTNVYPKIWENFPNYKVSEKRHAPDGFGHRARWILNAPDGNP